MADVQIPLIEVTPEPLPVFTPPACDVFLVAAYMRDGDGGRWKIHRETNFHEHRTREQAEGHARGLSPQWTSRCILHVHLGE